MWDQVDNPRGSTLRKIQEALQQRLGFAFPLVKGRGIFNYSFGLLAHRRPITTFVGPPLILPKIDKKDITDEIISEWSARGAGEHWRASELRGKPDAATSQCSLPRTILTCRCFVAAPRSCMQAREVQDCTGVSWKRRKTAATLGASSLIHALTACLLACCVRCQDAVQHLQIDFRAPSQTALRGSTSQAHQEDRLDTTHTHRYLAVGITRTYDPRRFEFLFALLHCTQHPRSSNTIYPQIRTHILSLTQSTSTRDPNGQLELDRSRAVRA